MLMKFKQNRMDQTDYTKLWAFWKKKKKNGCFLTVFLQRVDTILEDVSAAENIL